MPVECDASTWPLAAPRFRAAAAVPELARIVRLRRGGVEAMRAYQLARIRALVAHAAARVPAYDGLLTAEHATQLQSLSDLVNLPIVDKEHFLARSSCAWVPPGAPTNTAATSGTSGQPFSMVWSPYARWRGWVQTLRMMQRLHAPWLGRQLKVSVPSRHGDNRRSGLRIFLKDRRITVLETASAGEIAQKIRSWRPAWVAGQPHVLAAVAAELAGTYRPRLVTTHGVSSDDLLRGEIEQGFGRRPLDVYGAVETLQLASQCHAGDLYHLNHEINFVEVVDDAGQPVEPGVVGHVVVTNLLNTLMPMIRYRVGDGAVVADRPCACGEPFPALARVEGRTFDWIVDDAGRRVPPQRLWFSTVIDHGEELIARYRLRQDAARRVTVELVARGTIDAAFRDELAAAFRAPLGAGIEVEVKVVDRIDVPPGARFRQFTSEAQPLLS